MREHARAGCRRAGAHRIDAGLHPSGSITGLVRSKAGNPIAEISVFAFGPGGVRIADATSSAAGRYRIRNIPAGKYRICTDDNQNEDRDGPTRFDGRCLGDIRWFTSVPPASTTPVTVTKGVTRRHVDLNLIRHKFVPTATIAGQVTKASRGSALESVTVSAFTRDGQHVGQVDTDRFGNYRLTVPTTSAGYVVCFDASFVPDRTPPTGFANQCFKDQPGTV